MNRSWLTFLPFNFLFLLSLAVWGGFFMSMSACSRSPYQGSATFDCQGGDRLIVNERLFCVYRERRLSRPNMSDMMLDTIENDSTEEYCLPELAYAYVYETLTICTDDETLEAELIDAVVASWTTEYSDDYIVTGMGTLVEDMATLPEANDANIGVIDNLSPDSDIGAP